MLLSGIYLLYAEEFVILKIVVFINVEQRRLRVMDHR